MVLQPEKQHNFFKETTIGPQTVSNILKKKLNDEDYLFLIVDAKYIKINPKIKEKKSILFCIGIKEDLNYKEPFYELWSDR